MYASSFVGVKEWTSDFFFSLFFMPPSGRLSEDKSGLDLVVIGAQIDLESLSQEVQRRGEK